MKEVLKIIGRLSSKLEALTHEKEIMIDHCTYNPLNVILADYGLRREAEDHDEELGTALRKTVEKHYDKLIKPIEDELITYIKTPEDKE